MLFASSNIYALSSAVDSTKVVNLDEVAVVASRANEKTPIAFTNFSKAQLQKSNFGQDLPYLLSLSPSLITTSDAGAGIGYTSMRVRGTDASRINVTANGIPLNDAESHALYWVNMPDITSSLKDIQVQRGAGTSTNGAGAFGASINMITDYSANKPYATLDASYGMYNSHKETLRLGSGLLRNHWAFDLRLSNIGTDGYIDRATANLNSFLAQLGYFAANTSVRLIAIGGKENTYHAWNYASKDEMDKYGRTYNSCGRYKDDNGNVCFYDDQTDNYSQLNLQLILDQRLSTNLNLNVALHYTKGDGYYEEYKTKRTLAEYDIPNYILDGSKVEISDLIRRKKMDNNFGGATFSLKYKKGRVDAAFGGAFNYYDGWHFGQVAWVRNYVGALLPNQEYYRNKGKKADGNIFARADVDLFAGISAFGDLQYRHIDYKIDGANDNYDYATGKMQALNIHDKFNFVNPKVGLNWKISNAQRLFASFAIAQKEPTRKNYTDGMTDSYPKAERLYDYELGYNFSNSLLSAGANLYYMDYKDQLVLTGALSDTGSAMSENVPDSYRMGVELMFALRPCSFFNWNINATLSHNRIKNFTEVLYEDEWHNPITINHGDTPIAFSPDFTLNNVFSFNWNGFEAALQSQYVSKQYMSNAKSDEQLLDAYFVSNLHLAYNFKIKALKALRVGFSIYNIFNEEYENNGYAGAGYSLDKDGNKNIYRYAGYAAQAPTNVMGNISITF